MWSYVYSTRDKFYPLQDCVYTIPFYGNAVRDMLYPASDCFYSKQDYLYFEQDCRSPRWNFELAIQFSQLFFTIKSNY